MERHELISPYAIIGTTFLGSGVVILEGAIVRKGAILGNNVVVHPNAVIEAGVELGDNVEVFPGAYIGKPPKGAGATTRPIKFEERVLIGPGCSIGPNAVIYYAVEIGCETLIGDGASIREKVRIGNHCLISRCVTINYNTVIGDRTKVMDLTHLTGNCQIGPDVFISVGVLTTNDNAMGAHGYNEAVIKGPTVEKGSRIGAGANLLPGVRIGCSAVVGAGAVVTKDIPARKVVMGIPARVVRDVEP